VTLVCTQDLTVAQKRRISSRNRTSRRKCSTCGPSGRWTKRRFSNRSGRPTARSSWKKGGRTRIGAQVVDLIQRDAFDDLDAPVQRVTQADVPMPYNKFLERAAKASPEKVVAPRAACCTSNSLAHGHQSSHGALSPRWRKGAS